MRLSSKRFQNSHANLFFLLFCLLFGKMTFSRCDYFFLLKWNASAGIAIDDASFSEIVVLVELLAVLDYRDLSDRPRRLAGKRLPHRLLVPV